MTEEGIKNIRVTLRDETDDPCTCIACSMSDRLSRISFRHRGHYKKEATNRLPEKVDDKIKDKVLVYYYSSSGSGKTAELAGCGATRNAHFTILVTLDKDDERLDDYRDDA